MRYLNVLLIAVNAMFLGRSLSLDKPGWLIALSAIAVTATTIATINEIRDN